MKVRLAGSNLLIPRLVVIHRNRSESIRRQLTKLVGRPSVVSYARNVRECGSKLIRPVWVPVQIVPESSASTLDTTLSGRELRSPGFGRNTVICPDFTSSRCRPE